MVPKEDCCLRIGEDYRITVNPVLEINKYPLPRTDDLFAIPARGELTTIDLSHAYNQLILNEGSSQYFTINMQRGLYS